MNVGRYDSHGLLRKKIIEFFEDPPMTEVYHKGERYTVPKITTQSLAVHLGYSSKQSLYDLEKKGDGWADAIHLARSLTKEYYELHGQHGNGSFASWMLSVMGEKPQSDDDGEQAEPMTITFETAEPVAEVKITKGKKGKKCD